MDDDGGQMGALAKRLSALKADDPSWVFHFHHENNRLTRLFWQTPHQVALSQLFGGVIFLDTSQNRNKQNMPLATFLVIDDANHSRNIAHCLSSTETSEAFEWMLGHLKHSIEDLPWTKMHNVAPERRPQSLFKVQVIFTDRSAAMTLAIRRTLPDAWHGFCLFHLTLNLRENLLGVLGNAWEDFYEAFWYVYRCASPDAFDKAWEQLLLRFGAARAYLTTNIYPDREQWAWAWVGTRFTVGQRSTSRVETEHRVQKGVTKLDAEVLSLMSHRSADSLARRPLKMYLRN
jgi:hypothetical protein